jgi:hypothetical protein
VSAPAKNKYFAVFPENRPYLEPFGREDITMISLRQNPLDTSDTWGILSLDDRIMFRRIGDQSIYRAVVLCRNRSGDQFQAESQRNGFSPVAYIELRKDLANMGSGR